MLQSFIHVHLTAKENVDSYYFQRMLDYEKERNFNAVRVSIDGEYITVVASGHKHLFPLEYWNVEMTPIS